MAATLAPLSAKAMEQDEIYFDSITLMGICLEAECGNQPDEGIRMCADVIMNRMLDPTWPDTIEGVITQPGQFSSYRNGAMDRVQEVQDRIIQICMEEISCGPSYPGIFYFTAGGYSRYGTKLFRYGDHYFSGK